LVKKEKESPERKTYAKPELRRVTLKAEESLAAGCKTPATSAPAGATCQANSCFNFGS
jgi:hypothetical protein